MKPAFLHLMNKPCVKWVLGALLTLGVLASAIFVAAANGNYHAVTKGAVYRSGQLDADDLSYYIEQYGLQSILNLRGENRASGWYQDEIEVAQKYHVLHYDYGISANHEVGDQDIANILATIRAAPKPLLIHCRSGSDRSGLIAALYLYDIEGKEPDKADLELSVLYGHFPYLWNSTNAMDHTFWRYVNNHTPPKAFRD